MPNRMDQDKLYPKAQLFRQNFSELRKYVRGHGLPVPRFTTRAKLAKQLIAAGIYKKPASKNNSETPVAKPLKSRKRYLKNSIKRKAKPKAQSPKYFEQRKAKKSLEVEETPPLPRKRATENALGNDLPPSIAFDKRTSSIKSQGGTQFPGTPDSIISNWSFSSMNNQSDSEFNFVFRSRSYNNQQQSPRSNSKAPTTSFCSDPELPYPHTNSRPTDIPLSLKRQDFQDSLFEPEADLELLFPNTNSMISISLCAAGSIEQANTLPSNPSISRAGSNISIGGTSMPDKRTPESSYMSRSNFSFSMLDPDGLPASQTELKRDPSNSSVRSSSSCSVSRGEFRSRTFADSPSAETPRIKKRNDKQRDSIVSNTRRKKTLKSMQQGRKTKKGRRKKNRHKEKKRLAELKNETGERSSQELLGKDFDIPPLLALGEGERDTIHADPLSEEMPPRLPNTGGFREIKRQLSEELQGQEVNLESVKMHLLPLLSDNPKRILSDKESILLDDIASASYSEKLNHVDSIASVFINEMALAERSDSHCDEYGSHSDKTWSSSESLHCDDSFGFEERPKKRLLGGRLATVSDSAYELPERSLGGAMSSMRGKSELCMDNLIAEANEQYGESRDSSPEKEEEAPVISAAPRRMRMSLRALRDKEKAIEDHKQDLLDNVALNWQAKSSIDGFYFNEGDAVDFEGSRQGRVVQRSEPGGKVVYQVKLDDTGEVIQALESELVYHMILQIRRRTLSSAKAFNSQSSTLSSHSSVYYQTCTDRQKLTPRGGATFHSVSSQRSMV